ncbi:MAG: poly(3-hydroxyalkanoate) depolymerase [Pseudomonadales bacterium]
MDSLYEGVTVSEVSIDGIRLRVAQSGSEINTGRLLLIFNGIGANLELFFPLMERLLPRKCLIFDAPGAGGSSIPTIPQRFKGLAQLSAHLLDHFSVDQADVIGVSWGGALAQEFAYRHPQRCKRLILAATSPGAVMVPGKLSVLLKLTNPKRYFKRHYLRSHVHQIYGGIFRDRPALIDEFTDKVMAPDSKLGYYWQLYAALGWTSIHWLHQIIQPTLILAGNDDPIVPLINARIMRLRIPDSRMVEFDCGHLFLFTRVDEAASVILEFLNEGEEE